MPKFQESPVINQNIEDQSYIFKNSASQIASFYKQIVKDFQEDKNSKKYLAAHESVADAYR
jgi:hypothetical protein